MEIRLESTKYIGLAIGIIGIIALIFLLPQEKAFQIGTITQSNEGEKAILTGTIKDLSLSNGNAFFQIENNGSINAVYFSPKNEQIILMSESNFDTPPIYIHADDYPNYLVCGKVIDVMKKPDEFSFMRNESGRDILKEIGPISKADYDYYEKL